MRRSVSGLLFGLAAGLLLAGPASAVTLSENGAVAHLQGTFENGDDEAFEQFLLRPRAQRLRVLYLYSYGGKIAPAARIAEMVRRAGMTTAVDATRAVCDSACTLVFAAGVRRHYVGGDQVFEGTSSRTGLGYHPARRQVNMVEGSHLSEGGSNVLKAVYARMGSHAAAEMLSRASINTVYRPSGATALKLKLATSLAAPL
ncbi:MAG: hypothetical protein ABWZ80_10460 [Beijerinckiaceae bacterium]